MWSIASGAGEQGWSDSAAGNGRRIESIPGRDVYRRAAGLAAKSDVQGTGVYWSAGRLQNILSLQVPV